MPSWPAESISTGMALRVYCWHCRPTNIANESSVSRHVSTMSIPLRRTDDVTGRVDAATGLFRAPTTVL